MSNQPVRSDSIAPEKVDWLWNGRVPRGMITLFAGKPDQGKGLLSTRIAADVSNVSLADAIETSPYWGDEERVELRPQAMAGAKDRKLKVLFSAAEDSFGLMTRPRLEAAGADLESVLLWRFSLPGQINELAHIVQEQDIDLVIMDPLNAHLGQGVSRHSDTIRIVTDMLTGVVERRNPRTGLQPGLIVVDHVNKRFSKGDDPLTAIGGSGSGMVAASRAAYLLGVDPDDEDKRIMACVKCNIAKRPQALSFDVDVDDIAKVGDVPSLVIDQELMAFDPARLVEKSKSEGKGAGRPPEKRAQACEWLTGYLAAKGKVPASTVFEDAKHSNMTRKTLTRAAEDMQIVKDPPAGGRNCTWDLPQDVKDLMGISSKPKPEPTPEPPVSASDVPDGSEDFNPDGMEQALQDLLDAENGSGK